MTEPTTQLAHFDKARTELELARSIDEVKTIRDKAEAMRAYIRQRFSDLKQRIERKSRNILPEGSEDLVHSLYLDAAHNSISETLEQMPEAEVTVRRSSRPVTLSAAGEPADIGLVRRRTANGKKFRALLAALPEKQRVAVLRAAAETMDGPARKLAQRLLAAHSDSVVGLGADEDTVSVDPRSV